MTTTSQFKLERDRLLEEVKTAKPGNESLELLRKLRFEFDSAIEDYRNSLTILGDTTYEDRKHFLLELIQNADDAHYQEEDTIISFSIHDDSLEISYNETGFTTGDVIAITGTGASTKTANKLSANSFIGEKGIGFKSVFALAKEVRIESGPWSFKLHKDNYIVPELINPSTQNFTEGTKLRVYFSSKDSVTIVANELLKLVTKQLESFLFLQRLKIFHYRDYRLGLPKTQKLSIIPNKEKETLTIETSPGAVKRTYSVYEDEIEFPGRLVGARWERLGSQHSLKRKMSVAAMTDSTSQEIIFGRLFCYLPTEVKLPIPVYLQLDGHLKADRERLHDIENNQWNKYLLEKVPSFILHAILQWREDEKLASRLPDFIPSHSGEDQLQHVFEAIMDKCKQAPWVKTFDGWSSPTETVMAESFWYKCFEEHPSFRVQVEKVLGKKFMHPDWVANSSWKTKWKKYSISSLSAFQVVETLRFVSLPEGLLEKNENIISLYKHLFNHFNNLQYYEKREFIHELFFAKIFPHEGGHFGALRSPKEKTGNIYWMSGRTKRSSGLEGIIDIKIINPEYTYTLQVANDSSEERKQEAKELNDRNELIRIVLKCMEIPEFNDNRLLSELQIPFLLKEKETWSTEDIQLRYKVLKSIFEVYLPKTTLDEVYVNQLGMLSEAYVLGTNGKIKKLYQTILPEKVRIFEDDHLYASAGLDALELSDEWFEPELQGENQEERLEMYFKKLRRFLIHCGIANGPKFFFKERKYSNGWEFRQHEEVLYQNWVKKIQRDYTSGNVVTLKSVTLDSATLQLLEKESVTKEISKGIYQEWVNKFSRNLDNQENLYYRYDPAPGFLQTIYKRFDTRKPVIPDTYWAGVDRHQIPLVTADERLTNSKKAFKVRSTKGLDKVLSFFDIVVEGEGSGYHSFYLASLHLKTLTVNDINQKWKEYEKDSYDELMMAMYELSTLDVDLTELIIYDHVTEGYRPIRHFKLGKRVSQTTPYIEEQYGAIGKLVGQKLGLLVESEVTPLLQILDSYYSYNQPIEWVQHNITHLFKQSLSLRVDDKSKLIHYITELRAENNINHDTIVIFNDTDLYRKLYQVNKYVIHITCETMQLFQLKQAAKELGFVSIDEIGTIRALEAITLDGLGGNVLGKMFEKYNAELEEEESARLYAVLAKIGGKTNFHSRIYKTEELSKMVYEVSIPVHLPYYDSLKNQYFVSMKDSFYEIAARLLTSFGFTTYRSAVRDFKEIYEKLARDSISKVTNRVDKVKKPNHFTDVPVEYHLSDSNRNEDYIVVNQSASLGDGGDESSHQQEGVEFNQLSKLNKEEVDSITKPLEKHFNPIVQKQSTTNEPKDDLKMIDSESQIRETTPDSHFDINKTQMKQNHRFTLEEVLQQLSEHMVQDSNEKELDEDKDWKLAIDPAEGEKIRGSIADNIKTSLEEGPEYKEIIERKKKQKVKINDQNAQYPKEFLEHEYNGRCQICETQLRMSNGKPYFEVFRIREGKDGAWWNSRPFNILCLCPNCHALAKYGGSIDLSSILQEADLVKQQLTFTKEVDAYKGDYYVVEITHNGELKQMVLSSLHIEYFAALLEHVKENKLVREGF